MATPQQEGLSRYLQFQENLSPDGLKDLGKYFMPDARFKDPFNDVRGTDKIRRVFEDMFKTIGRPLFRTTDIAWSVNNPDVAYVRWNFTFKIRGKGVPVTVDGTSYVLFAADGRVAEHIDYWDAAQGLYEHLPVIGSVLKWIRGRIRIE